MQERIDMLRYGGMIVIVTESEQKKLSDGQNNGRI